MYIADTLSRAYIPGNPSVHAVTFVEIDMTAGLSVSHRRLQELRHATASDCVLQKLIQVTRGGWPSKKSDTDLDVRASYNVQNELTVQNGLLFKRQPNSSSDKWAKRHNRHGSPFSSGHTGLHSSGKGCRVLASDEPANHRLRQPVQYVKHISSGSVQGAPDASRGS